MSTTNEVEKLLAVEALQTEADKDKYGEMSDQEAASATGDISSLLRAAASQVAKEEQEEAEEALVMASAQLSASMDLTGGSQGAGEPPLLERNHQGELQRASIDENVDALMRDMNVPGEEGAHVTDDVDALLQMRAPFPSASVDDNTLRNAVTVSIDRKSYLRSISNKGKGRNRRQEPNPVRRGKSNHAVTEPSRIGMILTTAADREDTLDSSYDRQLYNNLDEQGILSFKTTHRLGGYLRKSFGTTPRQEMLLRSMKLVKPRSEMMPPQLHSQSKKSSRCLSSRGMSTSQLLQTGMSRSSIVAESKYGGTDEAAMKSSAIAADSKVDWQNSTGLESYNARHRTRSHSPDFLRNSCTSQSSLARSGQHAPPKNDYECEATSHINTDLHSYFLHRFEDFPEVAIGADGEELRKIRQRDYERMRHTSNRLSRDRSKGPSRLDLRVNTSLRHSTLSDAKECTFQPNAHRRRSKPRGDGRGSEDENDAALQDKNHRYHAFISRQEAEERNRRDELEFKMGRADYEARVDKKMCPQCGAKQSYDEFKEKRKTCPNCRVEYCVKVSWSRVGGKFFRNNVEYTRRREELRERRLKELEDDMRMMERYGIDPATGRPIRYRIMPKDKMSSEAQTEFFDRLAHKLAQREQEMKKIESDIYDASEKYTFTPRISQYAQERYERILEDNDEDADDVDPVEAFLKRYYEDLDDRMDKFPSKFRSPVREKKWDKPPFHVSTADPRHLSTHAYW